VDAETGGSLVGEFDRILLTEALRWISLSAIKMSANKAGSLAIRLKADAFESRRDGVIEWSVYDSSEHDPFHSFAGSNEIRLSLAARIIEAHGGSATRHEGVLSVRLPLAP
jgi:hypothetical protein